MAKQKDKFYFGRNSHDEEFRNQYLEENRGYLEDVLSHIAWQRNSKQSNNYNYPEEIMEEAFRLKDFVWKRSRNSFDRDEFIRIIKVLKATNGIDKETINIASELLSIDYMYALVKRYFLICKDNEDIKTMILNRGWDIESNDQILKNEEIEPEMNISHIPTLEYRIFSQKNISYSDTLRNNVIYEFLFNNKPIGWIETNLVPKEMQHLPKYKQENRGKDVSIIILNRVGLKFSHKGFFQGVSVSDAIEILGKRDDFQNLVEILKMIWLEKSQKKDLENEKLSIELSRQKQNFADKSEIHVKVNDNETEFQEKLQELPNPPLGLNINHKPKQKSVKYTSTISSSPSRDGFTSKRALAVASYLCEIDKEHEYFKSKASQENYVEAHHLIPIQATDDFDLSIDVEANIVSLCPNCHRKLHLAEFSEVKPLLEKLYSKRKNDLEACEIGLTFEHLISYYR